VTGPTNSFDGTTVVNATPFNFGTITSQDVMLGFRWNGAGEILRRFFVGPVTWARIGRGCGPPLRFRPRIATMPSIPCMIRRPLLPFAIAR